MERPILRPHLRLFAIEGLISRSGIDLKIGFVLMLLFQKGILVQEKAERKIDTKLRNYNPNAPFK